jgi:lipopolysaccharide biosynthesis glycosyltransferase
MDILICADRAYLKGLAVAVESLLASARRPCRLHLALDGYHPSTIQALERQWRGHPMLDRWNVSNLDHVPSAYRGNCHFSRASYGKISLRPLVDAIGGNLLVVDPDIIVTADVTQLAAVNMGHCPLGAVCDQDGTITNAGVLLVNMAVWSEEGIEALLLDSWQTDANVINAEQDLLIRVLRPEKLVPLEARWNILSHQWRPGVAGIIHCVGGRKPWHGDYGKNPDVQRLFFEHLDRTFLAGQRESALFGSLQRKVNKWRIRRQRAPRAH